MHLRYNDVDSLKTGHFYKIFTSGNCSKQYIRKHFIIKCYNFTINFLLLLDCLGPPIIDSDTAKPQESEVTNFRLRLNGRLRVNVYDRGLQMKFIGLIPVIML